MLGILKTKAYFGPIMRNLIIHPEDPTTTFLSPIYSKLKNKTVVRGSIDKSDLLELIESNDRVMMLGHGSSYGLLNPGLFSDAGLYIIDESMVLMLGRKSNSLFIWCYADKFVQKHGLLGLCTGMFISEVSEANSNCFENIDKDLIDQSNERFSWIISNYINQPIEILYQKILFQYDILARTNPIARYNLERLSLYCLGSNKHHIKMTVL